MKKIISIVIIGILLTTIPIGTVGEEVINEEQYSNEEILLSLSKYLNKHIGENGEIIQSNDDSETLPRFIPGELIVKFKEEVQIEISVSAFGGMPTTGMESIDQLNIAHGVISVDELFPDTSILSMSNIYKFTFPVDTEIIEIMSEYNSYDNVAYAEPNYLFTTSLTKLRTPVKIPNDPLFNQQWSLNQTGDHDIDAPETWNIKTGDSGVVIAIVDTGVDYNHPDLNVNIWHDPINGNPGYDFVDINTTLYEEYGYVLCGDEDFTVPDNDPMDVYGHGTHCAGIASAVTNNSIGVAGVSWNCKIMAVRNGFKIKAGDEIYAIMETDDSVAAIIYAADNGADVISMSFGGMFKSSLIKDALDYAYDKGVVLVAAAGNDNFELMRYPAGYKNVISVSATCQYDGRAVFSNYGESIDVAAPGVDILSTIPNGAYDSKSGTSMACPQVAGVAGLLISKNPQCPYPNYLAKSMIPFTADYIQTDEEIGGRVNAYKALNQNPFAAVLDPIPVWEDVKGTIDIRGAAWGEDFNYFVLEDGLGEEPQTWTKLLMSTAPKGGVLLSIDTNLLDEGLHTIRLRVVCDHGAYTDQTTVYVNNEANGYYDDADIYVSNCFDSSTPAWGVTKFNSIQDGVDHANSGNTIFVYDGIYPENVNISGLSKSSINLIGQNKNWTIIDGGIGISLTTKVTITGFCIRGTLFKDAIGVPGTGCLNGGLILKGCSNCKIFQNNIVMDEPCGWYQGIALYGSANNLISENTLIGFRVPSYYWYGVTSFGIIMFYCTSDTVSDNLIHDFEKNIFIGISSKEDIINNNIEGIEWGIIGAIFTDCVIENNNAILSIGISLDIGVVKRNKIMKNTFIEEDWTIHVMMLESAKYNEIIANQIEYGDPDGGIGLRLGEPYTNNSCFHSKIYYNNFVNCKGKDYGGKDSTNIWYKEKLYGADKGNYWSIYPEWHRSWYGTEAKDNNNDGIWDDPMIIMREHRDSENPNWDEYPVVEAFDIDNIDVSSDVSEYMTVEESELLLQIEEMTNSQIVSGELNTNEIIDLYVNIFSDINTQSRPGTQPSSQQQSLPSGSSSNN